MKMKTIPPLKGARAAVSEGIRTAQPDRWSFLKALSLHRLTSTPRRFEKIRGSTGRATSLHLVPPCVRGDAFRPLVQFLHSSPPSRGDVHVKIIKLIGWPAMIVVLFFADGCFGERPGNLRTESEFIELGGAKSAQVEIKIGVGELRVNGGAKKLLKADFLYNIARWKPEVTYGVTGDQGRLVVKQPSNPGRPWGNVRNEWNLRLSDDVPLDLRVELGVGKSRLEIGSLSLTGLNIQTGVGEALVDLTGDWKKDLDARIEGGIGELTLRLPDHIGLRIEAEKGIGSIRATGLKKVDNAYINNAFGKAEVTLRLRIQAGIGEINLEPV